MSDSVQPHRWQPIRLFCSCVFRGLCPYPLPPNLAFLAWEIPWIEQPGGPQSMGSQRVWQDLATKQQQRVDEKPKEKWKVKVKLLSCIGLFATPWTVAYQAPPSMGFSRQECWSGLPFPSSEYFPNPGIEPRSPALSARPFTIWATREVKMRNQRKVLKKRIQSNEKSCHCL